MISVYPRSYAQYTLLERLATGGMSEVDLARRSIEDAGYVRFLVIKRIRANHVEDEAFVRMFKDEARITSELRHTHIAQVYDFGRVGDEYYLALEYVPGTDLRAVTKALRKQARRMPVRQALKVAADVLAALHYAHTRTDAMGRPMKIVHRDVNPRNIMISIAGEVKLIDFGVARASDRLERTQTDHFKGKIAYMAPEQVQGKDLDHRVDVFAMGLTLYEMLAGRSAFAGLDQTQILYRILQGDLPTLEAPRGWGKPGRALEDLVARALAHAPDDRFASAEAMRREVARVAEAFGGMPETAELAAFVDETLPGLEDKVRRKMESWSGPLPADLPDGPVPEGALGPEDSNTLDRATVAPTGPVTGTLASPAVVAAGVGTVGLATVLVLVLVGGFVVGGTLWFTVFRPSNGPPSELATQVVDDPTLGDPSAGEPALPSPAAGSVPGEPLRIGVVRSTGEVGEPTAPPTSGGPALAPSTSEPPARLATTGDPAPERPREEVPPEGPDRVDGSADGEPPGVEAPEEAAEEGAEAGGSAGEEAPTAGTGPAGGATTESTPAPPDEPTPSEPAETGIIRVSAPEAGLPITIDGRRTRWTTGDEFAWPVGTHTVEVPGYSARQVTLGRGIVRTVVFR